MIVTFKLLASLAPSTLGAGGSRYRKWMDDRMMEGWVDFLHSHTLSVRLFTLLDEVACKLLILALLELNAPPRFCSPEA